MTEAAYFIQARALSLAYEAIQFPATAEVVLAWLYRAVAEAERRGLPQLADEVRAAAQRVTDHEDALEHFSSGVGAGAIEVRGYVPVPLRD
jgi:hypothetical protein